MITDDADHFDCCRHFPHPKTDLVSVQKEYDVYDLRTPGESLTHSWHPHLRSCVANAFFPFSVCHFRFVLLSLSSFSHTPFLSEFSSTLSLTFISAFVWHFLFPSSPFPSYLNVRMHTPVMQHDSRF